MSKRVLKSTADNPIRPDDKILKINDRDINDLLDYQYATADDFLEILVEKKDGSQILVEYDSYEHGPLDIDLATDTVKRCKNRCVFCFVHQLPRGLRKSLYVKDEDYRLSFTHGNYITLTNLEESDFRRIEEMHLSPLYISVHATDEALRRRMLRKKDAPDLMPQISRLAGAGIEMHTQVVLCPGINDGDAFERTIHDLAGFNPSVKSVSAVPVGLTRHRRNLPELRRFTRNEASCVMQQIDIMQRQFSDRFQSRFVFPSDEFFLMVGRDIPPRKYYEDFPQIENGVGMIRQLISTRKLPQIRLKKKLRCGVVTGILAKQFLPVILQTKLASVSNFDYEIIPVKNRLMGADVTVSGLLGGEDIFETLRNSRAKMDMIILPPNCLNDDNLFLDGWRPQDIEAKMGKPVITGCYSIYNTFMPIFRRLS